MRQYTPSSVNAGMALKAVISSSKRTLPPHTGTMRLCPITVPPRRINTPGIRSRAAMRQYTPSSVNTGMALKAVISSSKRTLPPHTGTMRLCPITVPPRRMTARFSAS